MTRTVASGKRNKTAPRGRKKRPPAAKGRASSVRSTAAEATRPGEKPGPRWRKRDVKLLVRAIFGETDPVRVGKNLLEKSGDATKAKSYFTMWEYLFGKPGTTGESAAAEDESSFSQFATHAPRPEYPVDPNSEDQRDKAMCRNSLAGAAGAGSASPQRNLQEE